MNFGNKLSPYYASTVLCNVSNTGEFLCHFVSLLKGVCETELHVIKTKAKITYVNKRMGRAR